MKQLREDWGLGAGCVEFGDKDMLGSPAQASQWDAIGLAVLKDPGNNQESEGMKGTELTYFFLSHPLSSIELLTQKMNQLVVPYGQ